MTTSQLTTMKITKRTRSVVHRLAQLLDKTNDEIVFDAASRMMDEVSKDVPRLVKESQEMYAVKSE